MNILDSKKTCKTVNESKTANMKQTKEYPATHSMSTAWYVADEDGNVGIMDFNENGPVPWQTEQTCIEDLILEHWEDYQNKQKLPIELTDEQIDDLMSTPYSPEKEETWWDCVIQIDTTKVDEFLKLANNSDFRLECCLSETRGLYSIDANHCTSETPKEGLYQILKDSTLQKMLDQKIILQVFKQQDYWMNVEWADEKVVHTKEFEKAPYYIFHQPYWTGFLPECMNVPEHPVKLYQLPEKLRRRVLRLPVKFKETKNFQIAEWHPCSVSTGYNSPTEVVDGCEYEMLPLTNGNQAYLCTEIILPSIFIHYCSEREKYDCSECEYHCHACEDHCFTNKPTVLSITNPFEEWDYSRQIKSDPIFPHSIWVPFLPKIPLKLKNKPNCWTNDGWQHYVSLEDIRKHVSGRRLLDLFQKNRQWLEDQVARFNPRVILISGAAEAIMRAVYPFGQNQITINGTAYPMYLLSEVESHREEIERLASLSYQGKLIPHIISVEEMERIKQEEND